MSDEKIVTRSPDQTLDLGRRLAGELRVGGVVGFVGSLGAGKTVMIRGICEGLGIRDTITSPTFNLINIYAGEVEVYHFDLYRLSDMSDLRDIGYEEYFFSGRGISLVEWSDRIPGVSGLLTSEIRIELVSDMIREIHIKTKSN